MMHPPERLQVFGRMVQPILWRIGECLAATPAQGPVEGHEQLCDEALLHLLAKLVLEAPPELVPILQQCQPLPESALTLTAGH